MPAPLIDLDWEGVAAALRRDRAAHAPQALDAPLCESLASAAPPDWEWEDLEEGRFRSYGMVNHSILDGTAAPVLLEVADEIVRRLEEACGRPVPSFNYVNWTRWPADVGRISAHRDPPGVGGIIAIATLRGSAPFRAHTEAGEIIDTVAGAGDLVVMAANGWPARCDRCPIHEVGTPTDGERVIVTFRHNRGGPSSDPFAYVDAPDPR